MKPVVQKIKFSKYDINLICAALENSVKHKEYIEILVDVLKDCKNLTGEIVVGGEE